MEAPNEASLLLRSLKNHEPFLFELRGENGFKITIGLADNCGCIQYSSSEGWPPYMMALANESSEDDGYIEFLAGDTPTPISRRFCLPINDVERIASDFLMHGEKSDVTHWEEI